MATIQLYASKINQMPFMIRDVMKSVFDFKSELIKLKKQSLKINQSVCNMDDVIRSIQTSTQTQEEKIESLDNLSANCEQFIADTVRIDGEVADLINKRKDEFYTEYEYLKPEIEKSGWEKFKDGCKKVGEWCKGLWDQKFASLIATVTIAIAKFLASIPIAGSILGALPSILTDMKNFDRSNTDEVVVLNAKYFSWYRDCFVIKWAPPGGRSFSFGTLFISPRVCSH